MSTTVNDKNTTHQPVRMPCPGVAPATESRAERIGGRAISWPKPRQSAEDDQEPCIERGRE